MGSVREEMLSTSGWPDSSAQDFSALQKSVVDNNQSKAKYTVSNDLVNGMSYNSEQTMANFDEIFGHILRGEMSSVFDTPPQSPALTIEEDFSEQESRLVPISLSSSEPTFPQTETRSSEEMTLKCALPHSLAANESAETRSDSLTHTESAIDDVPVLVTNPGTTSQNKSRGATKLRPYGKFNGSDIDWEVLAVLAHGIYRGATTGYLAVFKSKPVNVSNWRIAGDELLAWVRPNEINESVVKALYKEPITFRSFTKQKGDKQLSWEEVYDINFNFGLKNANVIYGSKGNELNDDSSDDIQCLANNFVGNLYHFTKFQRLVTDLKPFSVISETDVIYSPEDCRSLYNLFVSLVIASGSRHRVFDSMIVPPSNKVTKKRRASHPVGIGISAETAFRRLNSCPPQKGQKVVLLLIKQSGANDGPASFHTIVFVLDRPLIGDTQAILLDPFFRTTHLPPELKMFKKKFANRLPLLVGNGTQTGGRSCYVRAIRLACLCLDDVDFEEFGIVLRERSDWK